MNFQAIALRPGRGKPGSAWWMCFPDDGVSVELRGGTRFRNDTSHASPRLSHWNKVLARAAGSEIVALSRIVDGEEPGGGRRVTD